MFTYRMFLCPILAWTSLVLLALTGPTAGAESQLRRPAGVSIGNDATQPYSEAASESEVAKEIARPIDPATHEESLNRQPTNRAPADDSLAIRLAPEDNGAPAAPSSRGLGGMVDGPVATIAAALAVTLALFGVFAALSRRASGGAGMRTLPREAFEVIGQTAIGPRQKLMVVRCGVQALVVGVSPAGITPVAQIDDPDEAGQFIASCRSLGSAATFRNTLREMGTEPAPPGFVDSPSQRPKRGNLFLRA